MNFTVNPFTGQLDELGAGGGGGGHGGGYHWKKVSAADNPVTLQAGWAYLAEGALPVQFMLPPTAHFGHAYKIVGHGNLWTLGQNANQTVIIGIDTTTVGVGGSTTATSVTDAIEVVNIEDNLDFKIDLWSGNPTVV